MKRGTIWGAVAVLQLIIAGSADAATRYVDQHSDDPAEVGSLDQPFHTIGAAVATADPGDTISVSGGVYSESITFTEQLTVQGSEYLTTEIHNTSSWSLQSSGVVLSQLRFVGTGSGTAISATAPFTVEGCQIEDYYVGIWATGVSGNSSVHHSRLLYNWYGFYLYNSGSANHVDVYNNAIIGSTQTAGVFAYNSRWWAYNNLVSGYHAALYHYQSPGWSLPTSYLMRNLTVDSMYGIGAVNISAGEVKMYANAIDAYESIRGGVESDILWTVEDRCGAPEFGWDQFEHNFEPSGACIDAGVFGTDPDGSASDIGPYGYTDGGPWWQEFACVGPNVDCPCELDDWFTANPDVAAHAVWWEDYDHGWVDYPAWSVDLKGELEFTCTQQWYGVDEELTTPENLWDLQPGEAAHFTAIADDDARELYLSLMATSLIVEKAGLVPWSLTDLNGEDELAPILDGRTPFREDRVCLTVDPTPSFFATTPPDAEPPPECVQTAFAVEYGYTVPAPGPRAFSFVLDEGLIGADRLETIGNLVDWARWNMRHRGGSSDVVVANYYWGYPGMPPVVVLMEGFDPVGEHPEFPGVYHGFASWTNGCGSAVDFHSAILRALNIPVKMELHGGHGLYNFTSEGLYMSHGDDPYDSRAGTPDEVPVDELLLDEATYLSWFPNSWDGTNVGRQPVEIGVVYLPAAVMSQRCDDVYAGKSNADGVVLTWFESFYDEAALDAMDFWNSLDAKIEAEDHCPGAGIY